MYGYILIILMSHVLCFDQNRRRFGFDGPFVPPSRLGCRQIGSRLKVCTFPSRKQKHEHLVQIYTPPFFIDTLPSSTNRLYVWIHIDDIDVTHAVLWSKSAQIRFWRTVCTPLMFRVSSDREQIKSMHFSEQKAETRTPSTNLHPSIFYRYCDFFDQTPLCMDPYWWYWCHTCFALIKIGADSDLGF